MKGTQQTVQYEVQEGCHMAWNNGWRTRWSYLHEDDAVWMEKYQRLVKCRNVRMVKVTTESHGD